MTRPSTAERTVVVAKTLAFGDTPASTRATPTTAAGPHRQRIRHAKVCRGKVALTVPVPEATAASTSPSSHGGPPSRQHRPKPKSPRVEYALDSPPMAPPLEIPPPPDRPRPIHVTIVDNIRARKRTSGLRTAQSPRTQNGLLQSDMEGASTADPSCPDLLEDSLSPNVEDILTPLVSPNNPTCYSQAHRASWSGKPTPARRRSQSYPAASVDVSDSSLSSFSGDVSAQHVVAEIEVIKTILIREQLIERVSRAAAVMDSSVLELHALTKPYRRKSSGSASTRNGENNEVDDRPSAAQKKKTDTIATTLENRIVSSTKELLELAPELRLVTVRVVDAIECWRHTIDHAPTQTNRPHQVREFLFQRANYLEKMSHDLRSAYDGVALTSIFKGPPHPFLLSHDAADSLHASLGLPPLPPYGASAPPSTTFVTTSALVADKLAEIVATLLTKHLLSQAVQTNNESAAESIVTPDMHRATEAIFREHQRVHDDTPPCVEPPAYDPFDTIRQYPTVADAFESICRITSDTALEQREALRLRQQDTARVKAQMFRGAPKPLTMNYAVVEALVATKVAAETASIVASRATSTKTNRMAGHVLTRKKPSRTDPVLRSVVKIQAQFRRHQSRLEILVSLKTLSRQLHNAATNIQRIYRGHRAKAIVGQAQLSVWAEARYMYLNARRLQRWIRQRRTKRLQDAKRQVVAVVVEAPISPMGPSQTELYREAGRRRRMERDRAAAEKRAQAAILLQQQHHGCGVIQLAFRQYNKRKTMRMLQVARRVAQESNAATHIQAFIRCTLAKKFARQLRARRELDTVHHSSTLIQATYRGHRVRQRMSLAAALAASKIAGSPTKTKLPAVVLKPAVLKPQPARPPRRRSTVTVPKTLQSPRDRLPSLVQPGPVRRKSGVSWEELKLKEPRIGDQL